VADRPGAPPHRRPSGQLVGGDREQQLQAGQQLEVTLLVVAVQSLAHGGFGLGGRCPVGHGPPPHCPPPCPPLRPSDTTYTPTGGIVASATGGRDCAGSRRPPPVRPVGHRLPAPRRQPPAPRAPPSAVGRRG